MLEEKKEIINFITKNGSFIQMGNDKKYTSLSGIIIGVKVRTITPTDSEPYEVLQIAIDGGSHIYLVRMGLKYNAANSFLRSMPHIEPTHVVKLICFANEKNFDTILIEQHDQRYSYYYTKSYPKGKPDWIKTDKGWDNTDEIEFFKKTVIDFHAKLSSGNRLAPLPSAVQADSNPPQQPEDWGGKEPDF